MSANNQSRKLLAEYDRVVRATRLRLLEYYNPKMVWGLIAETRRELGSLISEIPYIGEHHVWQSSLNMSIMSLALYRVLLKNNFLIAGGSSLCNCRWKYNKVKAGLPLSQEPRPAWKL